MKVKLIKTEEVDFNLPEEKCEKISHNLFRSLINFECKNKETNEPKMVVFKTKEEYMENVCKYDIDLSKEVLINSKGNIFCYLQGECTNEIETNTEANTDVTADSEENKAE